ncbi:MAG: hypothetical protein AAFN78_00800 [Pseudomonadota bacterium]
MRHAPILLLGALLAGCTQPAAKPDPATPAPAAAPAGQPAPSTGDPELDSWYPRTVTGEKGTAVIHAPQIDSWDGFHTLSGWLAFQITRNDSDVSYYGSLSFRAQTDTDIAAREVLLHDPVIAELVIDGLDVDAPEYTLVKSAFLSKPRTVPLDLVLAYLPTSLEIPSAKGLNTEPPEIFVSTTPALLLAVESEPVFVPVGAADLKFVINTNWDVLRVGDVGPLYFCVDDTWLTAIDMAGPWSPASELPSQFAELPDKPGWQNARDCLPDNLAALAPPAGPVPTVFYSTEPAELLQLDGEPSFEAIGSGGLGYATNTDHELFRVDDDYYFLISGRWFKAASLDGPWQIASPLPAAFNDIPPEDAETSHPKSYVRKSIPGTRESWEAALVASIPRTAEIQRGSEAELNFSVDYAGDPEFVPIETTRIQMAINTSYQVFRLSGDYYVCHNAVWLTGPTANGPWRFADSIPDEFSRIPPSSPAYNTTFVSVEGSDEEAIQYAYTTGYENAYVENNTVVYGTGYDTSAVAFYVGVGYYAGWGYPYYPYYPWPRSYGYGSWYDPDTGRYGERLVGYGPYGAAAGTAVYNPETGVYARGQAVWDSDEYAGRGYAYNPNTDTSIAGNRYIDYEDNEGWSQRVARRGDEWRYTESEWNDGRLETEFESSRGTQGQVTRERHGDTIVSEGTVSRGDREASFESERTRQGDAVIGEGSITGENRSATFDSTREDGNLNVNVSGSEGGQGQLDRQLDNGEITGGGTFTRDGKTVETEVTRNAEGVRRDFETSEGGQATRLRSGDDSAFIGQTSGGDVYAGRDGKVYQKTDDGWSAIENPRAGADSAGNFGSRTEALPAGGFGEARTSREAGTYSGYRESASGAARTGGHSLDRDFQSRQSGFNRYSNHRSTMGAGRTMPRGGFRRR